MAEATQDLLMRFSAAMTACATAARPLVAAIRLRGHPSRSGTLWRKDVVIASEQALPRTVEAEVVLAAARLDVLTLIEDEILLSLPFAPSHAEGQCAAHFEPDTALAPGKQAPGKTSPFARLAALKKGTDRSFEE